MVSEASFNELDRIIQGGLIHVLLQPIAGLRQHQVHGFEALSRGPSDSQLHSPLALFEVAARCGRLFELELLCREIAIEHFHRLALPGKLFLNATPESLLQPDHKPGRTLEMLRRFGLSAEHVVIELTEQYPLDDYAIMRQATEHYRAMGFEIAIDDLGAGYSGLRMWSELRPDYVKIDKHFIQNIHEDWIKQEFVRSITDISKGLECRVIAEGIETQEEYQTVCQSGIEYGQGYYFARPLAQPRPELPKRLFVCNGNGRNGHGLAHLSESVAGLVRSAPVVGPATPLAEVADLFEHTPGLLSVAVVGEDNRPIGLAHRYRLMDLFASHYGRALHGKKPVAQFVDTEALQVEEGLSIEAASQAVSEHMRLRVEDNFIITEAGCYSGVGKVVDLLRKITDLQIRNARYANPLTLLPGNVPIYETLDRLLQEQKPFAAAYCDLDNFKPFNDVYGYAKGDQVLQAVADILREEVEGEHGFVGHVGGDDFILICTDEHWEQTCMGILQRFARIIPGFYHDYDRRQEGMWAKDRRGHDTFYPMLSLSIGLVLPDLERCHSHHDVAALASEAKRMAKETPGNSLFVDRRRGPELMPAQTDAKRGGQIHPIA